MAVIRIFEFSGLPRAQGGPAHIRPAPEEAGQEVTIAGTSDASELLHDASEGGATQLVSIQADAACHVVFGADPTATTACHKIQSGETADFWVRPGLKVAVIEA